MESYDHKKIEKKWQEKWLASHAYRADDASVKEKKYVLDMFPYPSGAGLHVGHVEGYTATDIYSRFLRMKGYEVIHPMGWDSFGLPAENYAIKTQVPPQKTTEEAIATFTRQINSLGLSYDWSRELAAHRPDYYRWTQWLFLLLYKNGLAYRAQAKVNWCPKDQTVLANEQVVDGACERCGTAVTQKDLKQWFFRITSYAEELISGLDTIDWPESTKIAQKNWIGKSEGAEITFPLADLSAYSGDVVFATNNEGKLKRMQWLFEEAGLQITLKRPKDIGIEDFDVVENGRTLEENVEKKARAVADKTDLPVLADDSGFYIENEILDPVKVKRNALNGVDEKTLSVEEVGAKMLEYYRSIASNHGGSVEAEWRNSFCLIFGREVIHKQSIRPVTLTNEPKGEMDPHLPLRPLYVSKATGKHVLLQTKEEELLEMQPIIDTIKELWTPKIRVFTTRPDTLYGATYMVLAPEHPLIERALAKIENSDEVSNYIKQARLKTDLERTVTAKEKTGVELKGLMAINPGTEERIPIFVADYVLSTYGTGAIMAVPAHDERDFEFAQKYGIPIRQVVAPYTVVTGDDAPRSDENIVRFDAATAIVKHWEEEKYYVVEFTNTHHGFVGGHIEEGETPEDAARREVSEESGYTDIGPVTQVLEHAYARGYKIRKSREEECHDSVFFVELKSGARVAIEDTETRKGSWKTKEEILADAGFVNHHRAYFAMHISNVPFTGAGMLVNSASFTGQKSEDAKRAIAESVGGTMKTTYRLRDWLISRQRYWGAPIPIIYCEQCGEVPVPDADLPVRLPEDVDFMPTGESPLARSKSFQEVTCPTCSRPARRESDTMDTFMCSSWYYMRFADPKNEKEFASKELMSRWLPVDLYVGGAEHTVLHLLYSRFFTKALSDFGLLSFREPFAKLRHQGLILAEGGEKMSKSKGNVVNPDDVVEEYGADSIRMYEMFMGPLDVVKPWNTKNIPGVRRFLERVVALSRTTFSSVQDEEEERLMHKTIDKVTNDIEALRFNTAISQLMIFSKHLAEQKAPSQVGYKTLLTLLAPFAPHLAHELWEEMGNAEEIRTVAWPTADVSKLTASSIVVGVQVNGKLRGTVELSVDASESEALALARENGQVGMWLSKGKEVKAVYVPGRIISFVVEMAT